MTGKPIAIYNCDKKELVGVFSELMYLAKYLYPTDTRKSYQRVYMSLKMKTRIYKTMLSFPVSVRFASDEQVALLTDQAAVIVNNYPPFEFNKALGFNSTRESWRLDAALNMKCNKNAKKS